MDIISTNNLTKMYGNSRGITNINLTIKEGEFFGFIGPNGAGKSTTIRILLGLIKKSEGDARLFGQKVGNHSEKLLRRVGYMPSETNFYRNLRIEEMIAFGAKLQKKDCKKEADRLCERFQLDKKKKIEELSLGNRKKVSIVCAMQHEPELYILDEATSGLDPLMQKEFFEELKEKNKKGATIFLSSHVLSEVQENCQEVGMVKDGKLISVKRVDEFIEKAAKKVRIRGKEINFSLPFMKNARIEGNTLTFFYQGSPGPLLKALEGREITELFITEPGLEEIFLHFYEKEEQF